MQHRSLPKGRRMEYAQDHRNQPGEHRAPIGVHGVAIIASEIGARNIQVGISIRVDKETNRPCLNKTYNGSAAPDENPDKNRRSARIKGIKPVGRGPKVRTLIVSRHNLEVHSPRGQFTAIDRAYAETS